MLRSTRLPVPVIVVGNVVAGGAGKTPVVIAVVQHLRKQGWTPGVVSRGYGRSSTGTQFASVASHAADHVGDEPALIASRCRVPVVVARRRSDAAHALLAKHPATDVIVCDDGLQHWALERDVEICVFGRFGVGNGWLLPAGPLREPWPRPVDFLLHTGPISPDTGSRAFALQRQLADTAVTADGTLVPLITLGESPLLPASGPLVAVAGTAHPEDFFTMLRDRGVALDATHALADHFDFDSWKPNQDMPCRLICTEKDAVKLWRRFPNAMAVPLKLTTAPGFLTALDDCLAHLPARSLSSKRRTSPER